MAMGRLQHLAWVSAIAILLQGQAAIAQESIPEAPFGPGEAELCASILQDRTDLMEECIAAEGAAHYFVMEWFNNYGLLTSEGEVDSMQLLEAQLDPMRAMDETPASTAAFCIETTRDWIGMSECLSLMEQTTLYNGAEQGVMGPEFGPDFDPGMFPEAGMN